jgi:hypothetical protein
MQTICQNEQQAACQNEANIMRQVSGKIGAGEGNRTLVISLEGCCSTIELHPHRGANRLTGLAKELSSRSCTTLTGNSSPRLRPII